MKKTEMQMMNKVSEYSHFLRALGYDLSDPNFKETPERVVKSLEEMLRGSDTNALIYLGKQLDKSFPSKYEGLIIIDNISAWGMCPHHMLPVKYEMVIGYMPNGTVCGASKLPRTGEMLAARACLQEDLTQDIADLLEAKLQPKGVMVIVYGQHMCMQARGIKMEATMITSTLTGVFKTNPDVKMEMIELLKLKGRG